MNNTKMSSFKRGLYAFSGFTESQILGCSTVEDVDMIIKKLLSDKLLMKAKNSYSFYEREQICKIRLLECSLYLLAEDDYQGVHLKIKELCSLIHGTDISHVSGII